MAHEIVTDIRIPPRLLRQTVVVKLCAAAGSLRSLVLRWAAEIDEADRISAAHSRHIIAADAQLVPLDAGGQVQAVRVSFEGQSFVLHQVGPLPAASEARSSEA